MIKKLSGAAAPLRICAAQVEIDETNPEATEARRARAVEKALDDGAAFAAIGGEAGRYEDDDVIIVTDDATFAAGARPERLAELARQAAAAGKPLVYVGSNGVRDGGKAIRVLDGGSCAFAPDGTRADLLPRFGEGAVTFDIPGVFAGATAAPVCDEGFDAVAEAVRHGTRAFLARLGIGRVVVGISGGIDSAVTAALYGSILKPEDLLLVAMPGPFTSQTTRGLSHKLAANLGARFAEIPIGEAVDLTCRQFAELRSEGPGGGIAGAWELSSFAVENVQARDRGARVLAAAAAAFGGVVSCNANKAEVTVGYGTLHGDILGWLSCLGDLWKGEVYALGRHLNEKVFGRDVIPEGIFQVKPSAELSASQDVEKGLGDPLNYPYHDKLFAYWVEAGATPDDCLRRFDDGSLAAAIGYDGDLASVFPDAKAFRADLCRWWNQYKGLAVAKRLQAPPVLAVSRRAFGEFPEIQSARRLAV